MSAPQFKPPAKTYGGATAWGWVVIVVCCVGMLAGLVVFALRDTAVPASQIENDALFAAGGDPSRIRPLALYRGQKVTVFGDSWTSGYSADPPTLGFAHLVGSRLGASVTAVLGAGGTGYVNPGKKGVGNYLARMRALPVDPDTRLLIIQGGLNDFKDNANLAELVVQTIAVARQKFPKAQIVMVGLAPPKMSNSARRIDTVLQSAAEASNVPYISPVQEDWIAEDNVAAVIDPSTEHPSTAGHAYIADQMVRALTALAPPAPSES
ncbi:SGNH/GDSL hydrolase family protein [Gordonia alkanivorans]|uniref:SGNH/GDSL hydrolase family protein n=1 Tax=Gordonia alkanivorans TaxID=84096 RepID=UPI0024498256|nr:SGNH/GDSL hydrolase family protein [Gordonia alkanivorans]MDH3009537.1 SGNH/GDSL hydrolase family protein [Gordonia alkanivorans]